MEVGRKECNQKKKKKKDCNYAHMQNCGHVQEINKKALISHPLRLYKQDMKAKVGSQIKQQ